jgi:hypothetical protein
VSILHREEEGLLSKVTTMKELSLRDSVCVHVQDYRNWVYLAILAIAILRSDIFTKTYRFTLKTWETSVYDVMNQKPERQS